MNPHQPARKIAEGLALHNEEAERGVLGAMILDNTTIPEVVANVGPDDFYADLHQRIFREIAGIRDAGRPVDFITLSDRLAKNPRGFRGEPIDYVRELVDSIPHAGNATYHAQIVHQKAVVRRLIEAANEQLTECYSGDLDADELVDRAEKRVLDISKSRSQTSQKTLGEAAANAVEIIKRRSRQEVVGLRTGIDALDMYLGGLEGPILTLIGGRPSQGKTALAINIAEFFAENYAMPVFVASLEMAAEEIGERSLSARTGIDSMRFRGKVLLRDSDWRRLHEEADLIRDIPITISDFPYQTAGKICSDARRFMAKHGDGIVVVDHIGLVESTQDEKRLQRHKQVGVISWRFKQLAKEFGRPVVVLCQLSREVMDNKDCRPHLGNLRESGELEQNADKVVFVHRPEMYGEEDAEDVAELIVAKNRNGMLGTARVKFDKARTKFQDLIPAGVIDGGN